MNSAIWSCQVVGMVAVAWKKHTAYLVKYWPNMTMSSIGALQPAPPQLIIHVAADNLSHHISQASIRYFQIKTVSDLLVSYKPGLKYLSKSSVAIIVSGRGTNHRRPQVGILRPATFDCTTDSNF